MKVKTLFLIFSFAAGVYAQERFVRPADDAGADSTFLAFRTKLIAAAKRRDANAILAIVDPRIKNGFGGNDGITNFKKHWKINNKNSDFWAEFLKVIMNGGGFSKEGRTKLFVAPYTFSDWPEDLDGFDHHAIFGNNVNLREKPSTDSRVIGQLSFNVVRVDGDASVVDTKGKYTWVKVTTLGGKTGFVNAEFIRSPIDFRAGFEKKRGAWKMTFFLAGD